MLLQDLTESEPLLQIQYFHLNHQDYYVQPHDRSFLIALLLQKLPLMPWKDSTMHNSKMLFVSTT